MRIRIRILRTKVHVELRREYLPRGNLMPLILRTNLLCKPDGNAVAIVALSTTSGGGGGDDGEMTTKTVEVDKVMRQRLR